MPLCPISRPRNKVRFSATSANTNSCLLCEYWEIENKRTERLVIENDQFTAVVPFWAAALRNARNQQASLWRHGRILEIRARRFGGYPAPFDFGLRQPVRNFVPILHGISPAPHRRRAASRVAFPRAFLSAAAALPPQCANSWSATNCSARRSETLHRKKQRHVCARPPQKPSPTSLPHTNCFPALNTLIRSSKKVTAVGAMQLAVDLLCLTGESVRPNFRRIGLIGVDVNHPTENSRVPAAAGLFARGLRDDIPSIRTLSGSPAASASPSRQA